jgi:hypothetical protein
MANEKVQPKLISIESVEWPSGGLGTPAPRPTWKIVFEVPQLYESHLLQTVILLDKAAIGEDAALPFAKNCVHNLLRDAAESSREWALSEDQCKALRTKGH